MFYPEILNLLTINIFVLTTPSCYLLLNIICTITLPCPEIYWTVMVLQVICLSPLFIYFLPFCAKILNSMKLFSWFVFCLPLFFPGNVPCRKSMQHHHLFHHLFYFFYTNQEMVMRTKRLFNHVINFLIGNVVSKSIII